MTLLEAISPTARASSTSQKSGGGGVNIVKNTKRGKYRIHAANSNYAPICGGGNSARGAQWQEVILEPDCQRCAQILQRRSNPQPKTK